MQLVELFLNLLLLLQELLALIHVGLSLVFLELQGKESVDLAAPSRVLWIFASKLLRQLPGKVAAVPARVLERSLTLLEVSRRSVDVAVMIEHGGYHLPGVLMLKLW